MLQATLIGEGKKSGQNTFGASDLAVSLIFFPFVAFFVLDVYLLLCVT